MDALLIFLFYQQFHTKSSCTIYTRSRRIEIYTPDDSHLSSHASSFFPLLAFVRSLASSLSLSLLSLSLACSAEQKACRSLTRPLSSLPPRKRVYNLKFALAARRVPHGLYYLPGAVDYYDFGPSESASPLFS